MASAERITAPSVGGNTPPTEDEILTGLRYWFGPSVVEPAMPPLPEDPKLAAKHMASEVRAMCSSPSRRRARTPKQERTAWEDFASDLPDQARCRLERVRTVGLRFDITEDFEGTKFAWLKGYREVRTGGVTEMKPVDRVERSRGWRRLFSGPATSKNLADLQLVIDNWIEPIAQGRAVEGRWPDELPVAIKKARVISGILTIDEGKKRNDYPGVPAFVEQTPPEVFYLDARSILRRLKNLGLALGTPGAWDTSAGSGTGAATLQPLGWRVVSTDLSNAGERIKFLDARNVGASPYHQRPFKIDGKQVAPLKVKEREIVRRPHLIFLDVSSRGNPTHAEEYGQGVRVEQDFASLNRAQLVGAVAGVVARGLALVRRGGCFSLTMREAWRSGSRIVPDHGLTNDILELIRTAGVRFEVIEDYRVVYESPRNQACVGSSRAPIRHVLLGRAT